MRKVLFFGLLFGLLSSCWPTQFLNPMDNSMPEEWKKFFVQPLEVNTATAPNNYPANLSEKLRSGVQNNTRLKLASKLEDAEVQISGTIASYGTSPIAIQTGDVASKNRLTVSVNFTIITPTKGLEKIVFTSTRFADYESSQQLSDVETSLLEDINQQITQDLVNKLMANW